MNRIESRLNGIVLTVAYLPKFDKFTLTTMDSNIPLELFEVSSFGSCHIGNTKVCQRRMQGDLCDS